jgi:hypothetical protein
MDGVIPLPPAPPRVTADVMADAGSSVLSAIQPLAVDETAPMVAIDPLEPSVDVAQQDPPGIRCNPLQVPRAQRPGL